MIKKLTLKAWNSPVITSWLQLAMMSLRGFLLIPLVVTVLTEQEITVYYLFNSFLAFAPFITSSVNSAYLRGTSFAWGGATSYEIAKAVPKGTPPNEKFFGQIYRSSNLLMPILAAVVILLIGIVGYFGLKKQILELPDPQVGWLCWAALLFCVFLKIWLDRNSAILKGVGRIAQLNRFSVFFGLANIAIACALLAKGIGLFAIPIGLVVTYFGLAFLQSHLLKSSEVGHLLTREIHPIHKPTVKSVWTSSSRESVVSVLTMGVNRGAAIIAAFFLVGGELTTYLNAVSLMIIVSTSSRAPFYAHNPRFAKLRSAHRIEELAVATGKGIRNTLYAFVIFACAVAIVVPAVFEEIGSNVDFIDPKIWLLLALVTLIGRYEAMNTMILKSSNEIPFVKEQMITGVLKIVLMIIGVKYFGVVGIILSQGIASMLIMNWLAPKKAWELLGEYASVHRRQYVTHVAITIIICSTLILYSEALSNQLLSAYRLVFT